MQWWEHGVRLWIRSTARNRFNHRLPLHNDNILRKGKATLFNYFDNLLDRNVWSGDIPHRLMKSTKLVSLCSSRNWESLLIYSLWPSGIDSRLWRIRLWVRFLAVSDIYPMFIEPTITWVPSGFSGYIWLDTKIVLKNTHVHTMAYLGFHVFMSGHQLFLQRGLPHHVASFFSQGRRWFVLAKIIGHYRMSSEYATAWNLLCWYYFCADRNLQIQRYQQCHESIQLAEHRFGQWTSSTTGGRLGRSGCCSCWRQRWHFPGTTSTKSTCTS